ncbi:hypothetical protein JTE90_006769 [Oedothorax gibbosus]|uniref:Uncharacterized protein n=1 Tax=Oedothorax gibbosus TaxID=931172 RepID=A0AAV6UMA6_9ARAC|nr:hypothetical protein JTE90_006769 [Oedothorax gibbosus]
MSLFAPSLSKSVFLFRIGTETLPASQVIFTFRRMVLRSRTRRLSERSNSSVITDQDPQDLRCELEAAQSKITTLEKKNRRNDKFHAGKSKELCAISSGEGFPSVFLYYKKRIIARCCQNYRDGLQRKM